MSEIEARPLFSIITVVRNDAMGFARTQNSIRKQNFREFEWIVIDGASSDDTLALVCQTLITNEARGVSEPDDGIYSAMNKGLTTAIGEYVIFLNAGDCFVNETSLAIASETLINSNMPDVAFFASKMDFGRYLIDRPTKDPSYISHGQPGLHQATFIARTVHLEHPFSNHYKICGDYDVLARIYVDGYKIKSFPQVISVNIFDANSTSGRHKVSLILEAFHIQRLHLKLPLWRCCLSALRRSLNSLFFKFLTFIRK